MNNDIESLVALAVTQFPASSTIGELMAEIQK